MTQQADTQSFADAFSYIQISDEVPLSHRRATLATGVVVDYKTTMDTLVPRPAQVKAAVVPVSLASGGVLLLSGAHTDALLRLKLGLSGMAGQIRDERHGHLTPFDV